MIPVRVSFTTIQWGSADPNWGSDEFLYEEYGKNDDEYKSEGEHSKQVYDMEILELLFLHHNLDPNFYLTYEEDKVRQVKINLKSLFTSIIPFFYKIKHSDWTRYSRYSGAWHPMPPQTN